MLELIRRLFIRRTVLMCGGTGCCEVVDAVGRVVASIWYRRPDSSERLDYAYQLQHALSENEGSLREIEKSKNKARAIHEAMWKELHQPFARKLFVRCSGYVLPDRRRVETLPAEEQFEFVQKFFSGHLSDMVGHAFATEVTVKKKF